MRLLLLLGLLASWTLPAQRIVTGKVLEENFDPAYCYILINDKTKIGETDFLDGSFSITLPDTSVELIFYSMNNLNETVIQIPTDCNCIELITVPYESCYLGRSPKRIDRIRKKTFSSWLGLHQSAVDQGVFSGAPCYSGVFVSKREILEAIKREMTMQERKIKLTYQRLMVGDTIYVPFSPDSEGEKTRLSYYSAYAGNTDKSQFGCYLQAVVEGKKKHYRSVIVVFEVTSCGNCMVKAPFLEGRPVQPGTRFVYDMGYSDLYRQ